MAEVAADDKQLKAISTVSYALQAAGFFFGITWIAAVVVDYVKRDDAAGTWLESHFRWRIRTFWWSLLWCSLGFILAFVLVGFIILAIAGVWMIYRVTKGWLRLSENRPVS